MAKRTVEFICAGCNETKTKEVAASYIGKPTFCSKDCQKKSYSKGLYNHLK